MISPRISPREVLGREIDVITGGGVVPGMPGSVEYKRFVAVQEQAELVLQRACVSEQLTPFVVDPHGNRLILRSDYFELPGSRTFFYRDTFQIWDLDAWTVAGQEHDPVLKILRDYNGWPTGFEKPKVDAWFEIALKAPSVDSNAFGKALADHNNVGGDSTKEEDDGQTGMPGRPSKGAHLIAMEFRRRCDNHEVAESLNEEAESLRNWYVTNHLRFFAD